MVYLDYDVEGEPWHERLLLAPAGGAAWAVLSPDNDMFIEDLAVPPLGSVRVGPGGWALPHGLGVDAGNPVYRFRTRPTVEEVARLTAEALPLAALHLAQSGHGPSSASPESVEAPPGLVLVAPVATEESGPGSWIHVDEKGGGHLGDIVSNAEVLARGIVRGDVALYPMGAEGWCALHRVTRESADAEVGELRSRWAAVTPRGDDPGRSGLLPRPPAVEAAPPAARGELEDLDGDARTLAVLRNSAGERFRDLRSVAERSTQLELEDWALEGPRTALWYVTQVARTGTGLVARHQTWRHENKLEEESHLCSLHEIISEILEMAASVDQLDIGNLVSIECACRQLQYVEHEVKKKADARRGDYSAEAYFLGRTRRSGGALIAPELLKWVSEKAARDSAVLKEQRKAAEERALARKTGK